MPRASLVRAALEDAELRAAGLLTFRDHPSILERSTAWYRSDRLITLNGSTVSAWGDLTGNGNNATETTEAEQFTYVQSAINGKPALKSVSSDSLDISIAQAAPIYVFAAVDTTNMGTGYRQLLGRGGTSPPALYLGSSGNDRKPTIYWGAQRAVWGTALSEVYVVRFRMEADGTNGVKVNNEAEVTSPSTTSLGTWNEIGDDATQPIDDVLLGELAILQGSALTDAESDSIIDYMMSRYGIT